MKKGKTKSPLIKGKIHAIGRNSPGHDITHLSPEDHELLVRLNNLANSYPFNVLYRYPENLRDIR